MKIFVVCIAYSLFLALAGWAVLTFYPEMIAPAIVVAIFIFASLMLWAVDTHPSPENPEYRSVRSGTVLEQTETWGADLQIGYYALVHAAEGPVEIQRKRGDEWDTELICYKPGSEDELPRKEATE